MSTFFPALATNRLLAIFTGLGGVWLVTYINTRGIVAGGKLQLATTILKVLPLVLVAGGGLFFIKARYFLPFNTSGGSVLNAIGITGAMTMFSYFGIESATVPAGDVKDPQKTIPRATITGLFVAAAVYILGSISVMGMIPAKTLAHSLTPYSDAAAIIYGQNARYWVSGGMVIAAFGALNGWTLVQGQLAFAVANDKLFPAFLGKKNKANAPYWGMVINAALITFFISLNYTKGLVDQFRALLLLAVLTCLIPFLFSVAAYPVIRARQKNNAGWGAAITLALLAFAYTLWMIAGSGQQAVFYGFLLLMAGIPFYLWQAYKKEHRIN